MLTISGYNDMGANRLEDAEALEGACPCGGAVQSPPNSWALLAAYHAGWSACSPDAPIGLNQVWHISATGRKATRCVCVQGWPCSLN